MGNPAVKLDTPTQELPSTEELKAQQDRWRAENSAFIAAYNQVVEEEGVAAGLLAHVLMPDSGLDNLELFRRHP